MLGSSNNHSNNGADRGGKLPAAVLAKLRVTSMIAATRDTWSIASACLRTLGTALRTAYYHTKVVTMVVVVLFLLPLVFGFWIDWCAYPLTHITMAERMRYVQMRPLVTALAYFLLGFAVTLNATHIITVAR